MAGCCTSPRIRRAVAATVLPVLAISFGGRQLSAQEPDALPFAVGERLEYSVRVSRMKASGRGTMSVEGPADVRGSSVLLLRFDFRAGLGPFRAIDRTESWIDPVRMVALRFHKHERTPVSRGKQAVELYPEEKRWEDAGGTRGESPTDLPLDELSFIYFVRTLPLADDSLHRFDRHFQQDRNPISIRVLGRETIATGVGELATILVEMRVRDPARYKDADGIIRVHFTDDHRRIPARIESSMPVVGKAVMTLESIAPAQTALSDKP